MSVLVIDTSSWIAWLRGAGSGLVEPALEDGRVQLPPVVSAELLSGRFSARERGLSVSTPDAHVAQCALDLGAVLLTEDAVFSKLADHLPLRLAK